MKRKLEIIEELKQIEARSAELEAGVETAEQAEIEARTKEAEELQKRQSALKEELQKIEAEKRAAAELNAATATEIKPKENETMERKITIESEEYRNAFYAMIAGKETEEQRTVLSTPISVDGDSTYDGAAIAIPKSLDTKIWDNIHTAHPILKDINVVKSGVIMEVTRHTTITNRTSSKKDGAVNSTGDQENVFTKVQLTGKDYETYVELTYAEAKMSQGALEDYLAQEIADELGEALAKDVFARVLSDATTAQKITSTNDIFADVKAALAKATLADAPVVYAPASDYYDIVGATNTNGTPVNIKGTFGCEIKRDDAATKVTILDPAKFILNEVQAVMIETDKDIKVHKVIVSGYQRAEGCLRKTTAASYID